MIEYKGQMRFVLSEHTGKKKQQKNKTESMWQICNRNRWGNNWITSEICGWGGEQREAGGWGRGGFVVYISGAAYCTSAARVQTTDA